MCRETLWDYAKKPEFSHAVKFARMRLEHSWEQRLAGPNATGTIFWLKNQGWSDTTKVEMNANVASVSRIELVAPDLDDNGAA